MPDYVRAERIWLTMHPELREAWVQEIIAADPTILGLGDLVVIDKECLQSRAGRLDLLLRDRELEAAQRYEVELQLGATDELHIIRVLEYWDIERKAYPQYDHTAVLIAEDITSRFLNVISLFHGHIPLVAIQLQAFLVAGRQTLVFTKVMDAVTRGLDDEDDPEGAPTDRAEWEARGSRETLQLADEVVAIAKEFDPTLDLKFNKFYVGLARGGQPDNFVSFRPRKKTLNVEIRLPRNEEIDARIEAAGIDTLAYGNRSGRYRLSVDRESIAKHRDLIKEMIGLAFRR